MLTEGLTHTSVLTVGEEHSAARLGSGGLFVLATPMMMALMENAALLAVDQELPEEDTTVGGYIASSHLKPTALGEEVYATATLEKIEGKKLTFHVIAKHGDDVIGEGTHIRFIVNRKRFMEKL